MPQSGSEGENYDYIHPHPRPLPLAGEGAHDIFPAIGGIPEGGPDQRDTFGLANG